MNSNELFLKEFIKRFYTKSRRKVSIDRNNAKHIYSTINIVNRNNFGNKNDFEEIDVYKAFHACGYTLMRAGGEKFTWRWYKKNSQLFYGESMHINATIQSNSDLRSASMKKYPHFFKKETVDFLNDLKFQLELFWEEYNKWM